HSAQFKERTNLLKSVTSAMEEAIDQGMPVLFPPVSGWRTLVTRAHADLAQSYGSDVICTVPLACAGKAVGAITFERSSKLPFDADAIELCEVLAGLAGPFLDVHRREDQWFPVRVYWWSRTQAQ